MTSTKPQCAICLATLSLQEISALYCGHTFHPCCITPWLQTCKTCPVCRHRVGRNFIRQLFFQMEDDRLNFGSDDPAELKIQLQAAMNELQKEKEISSKAAENASLCMAQVVSLEEKVAVLETVNVVQMQKAQLLDNVLAKYEYTEAELNRCRKRLVATEFYKLLANMREDPVSEIDKYIGKDSLEAEKFITLLRRQVRDAMKTSESQSQEIRQNRKKINEMQRKLDEYEKTNMALRKELTSLQASFSQPFMSSVEEFTSSSTGHSIPSTLTNPFHDEHLSSVPRISSPDRTGSGKKAATDEVITTPVQRSSRFSIFTDEAESFLGKAVKSETKVDAENDMEEVFVPPAVRNCAIAAMPRRKPSRSTISSMHQRITTDRESVEGKTITQGRKKPRTQETTEADLNDTITLE